MVLTFAGNRADLADFSACRQFFALLGSDVLKTAVVYHYAVAVVDYHRLAPEAVVLNIGYGRLYLGALFSLQVYA